jgi:hypothetical protein
VTTIQKAERLEELNLLRLKSEDLRNGLRAQLETIPCRHFLPGCPEALDLMNEIGIYNTQLLALDAEINRVSNIVPSDSAPFSTSGNDSTATAIMWGSAALVLLALYGVSRPSRH